MISLEILENSNYNKNNNKIIHVHNNFTKYSNNPQVDSIASKEDMEIKMNEFKPSLLTHVPLTSFTESLYMSMKSNDNGNSLMSKVTPAKLS